MNRNGSNHRHSVGFRLQRKTIRLSPMPPSARKSRAIRLGHTFGHKSIYWSLRDHGRDNLNRTTLAVLIDTLWALTRRKVKLSDIVDHVKD
jgi:hypothetical protein